MSGEKRDALTNDLLTDHAYDGIHELDNPLPQWWLLTFYGAIVFSFAYVLYYHVGSGPSQQQEFDTEVARLAQLEPPKKGITDEDLKLLGIAVADPAKINTGHAEFLAKCSSCHGPNGEGLIGPNLTDAYWIHGDGSASAILTTIRVGVPEKGMPPWEAIIPPPAQYALVAHIVSLKGTHPANPKAPQGNAVK